MPESLPEPVLPEELPPPLVAPLAPPEALGEADDPDDLAFLAFLVFFLAFAFGLVSAVASVAPAAELPEVAPVEPVPVVELPVALGEVEEPELVPVEPVPVVEDDPDAPVALLPDAPDDVSLAPDALEPEVPLAPEVPEDDPGCGVFDGTELEVPLPPDMPASLPVPAPVAPVALCDLIVEDGSDALLLPDCANAMDDTDATTISDSERRVVFNVMSYSFELEKRHHRCSSLDTTPARLFSSFHTALRQNALDFFQLIEFKDFLTM